MMEYQITTIRVDAHGSVACCKEAEILHTDVNGRADAFNPAEDDHRLDLMLLNIRKYGTIYNTVAAGTELNGIIRRAEPA